MIEKLIAWLKKLNEPKYNEPKYKVGDFLVDKYDEFPDNLSYITIVAVGRTQYQYVYGRFYDHKTRHVSNQWWINGNYKHADNANLDF